MSKSAAKKSAAATPKPSAPPTYSQRALRLTTSVRIERTLHRSGTIIADVDPKIEAELLALKVAEYVPDSEISAPVAEVPLVESNVSNQTDQ